MDPTTTDRAALEGKVLTELQKIAGDLGIQGTQRLRKAGLIDAIVERAGGNGPATDGAKAAGRDDGGGGTATATATAPATTDAASDPEPGDGRGSSGNGGVATEERQQRDREADRGRGSGRGVDQGRPRQPGGREQGGQGGGAGGGRRRPSREERRRQREERRQREVEAREEELATAPTATGLLDVLPEGYGFLRTSGYLPGQDDIYVSLSQIRRFMLRKGDTVTGQVRRPKDSEKYHALLRIENVNGLDAETAKQRPNFEKLTPLFPDERFRLEHAPTGVAERWSCRRRRRGRPRSSSRSPTGSSRRTSIPT
jgi:transcription termination factor Rho